MEDSEKEDGDVTQANNWAPINTDEHNVTVINIHKHGGAVVAVVHT